ncbi:NAD-dependent epimerase/dehydratase family protein [Xenophilus aerolatus]|nr:hypothetical protein [Xenophilus aerolatus]
MLQLIGGRGRLGQALLRHSGHQMVRLLPREVYEHWWQDGSAERAAHYFSANAAPGDTVCVLAGVLDPKQPEDVHDRVNFALPCHAAQGAIDAGLRVVTFGSVMERFMSHPNRYVATKARLSEWIGRLAETGAPALHLQIHTLYGGGPPSPFMFLGQMYEALKEQRPFAMSSGRQIREYHHVDDDAVAINLMLDAGVSGLAHISHGEALTLRELALGVMTAIGKESQLLLGELPDPASDNFAGVLERSALLDSLEFRKTVPAVAAEMQTALASG